tara:strand:+ start:1026 stop:2546 length:1521 start_codon:yes stop_codon:yes gene_type:complete
MSQHRIVFFTLLGLGTVPLASASVVLPEPAGTMMNSSLPADIIPVSMDDTSHHSSLMELPSMEESSTGKYLSVNDAILLALRNNPNVFSAQLTRIMDKYNLEIAHNAFQPHYSLNFNQTYQNNQRSIYEVSPTVSLDTTMGTSFSVNNTNDMSGDQQTNLNVSQHLLKGFGAVNNVNYLNALDNEKTAKLSYQSSITNVVMSVVTDYRSLVSAELNLIIDQKNLKATQKATEDDALRFKAGKLAKSELIQQQATLASAKLSYQSQLNSVQTTYQSFLSQLGVSPWAKFTVDKSVSLPEVKLPSLEQCIQLAFKNNVDYQREVIELEETRRSVLTAKNNMKWTLDANLQQELETTEGTSGSPVVVSDVSASDPVLSLSMSIPIDNLQDQSSLIQAKIAYREAKENLEQSKRDLMIQVQKQYQAVLYDQQQIPIGEQSVKLEKMSLENVQLKFKFGKATALDVSTIQTSYVESQSSLVSYRISLLNDLMELDNTLGRVLNQWGISLRY